MTLAEIHALRAERTELLDLLDDVRHVLGQIDFIERAAPDDINAPRAHLLTAGHAHTVLGNCLRFRAETDLF